MPTNPSQADFVRYLNLLAVRASEPDIDSLTRIVRAHVTKVPFENISKLYYHRTSGLSGLVALSQFLDGIEGYHFGGTCYPNNYHLHQLLKYLGYEVRLCGADMSRPDLHLVNVVKVDGREYLVDVGYAAPFLEPLPLELTREYEISLGSDRYVLKPTDGAGHSCLTAYRDGIPSDGYTVNSPPRTITEFAHVIADSFRADATFMNNFLLARFGTDCSYVLRNMTYMESNGRMCKRVTLRSREAVISLIRAVFGIPPEIACVALERVSMDE